MKQQIEEPVGVFGIGVEGRATINYLRAHNIGNITALDLKQTPDLPEGVASVFGPDHDKRLTRFATIFRSPGIRPDHPSLFEARVEGRRITSAISLFLEECPAPVIGITGTLGKGTASALTHHLLQAAGFTVHLGGNIGKSPLEFLDEVKPDHRVVLEISSFQAMDATASPHIGVVLKTTSEHLDWHTDLQEYRAAKSHLFAHQTPSDKLIFNMDAEGSAEVALPSAAQKIGYSMTRPLEMGMFFDGRRLIRCEDSKKTPLDIRPDRVRLPGMFNLENIAAAAAAALEAGASLDKICPAAESFEGLPHRLQFVTEYNGVRFFNDSYATRPDATLGALASFRDVPLALIMGGSEKFADFSELADAVRNHPTIQYAALIGQTATRLEEALHQRGPCRVRTEIHEGLESAMEAATDAVSAEGGVVLMSPACASFGLFPNYKVRGERFIAAAQAILEKRRVGIG
jgi:UDP-N-acetylmuramoylalanine--D-glutamate ligase